MLLPKLIDTFIYIYIHIKVFQSNVNYLKKRRYAVPLVRTLTTVYVETPVDAYRLQEETPRDYYIETPRDHKRRLLITTRGDSYRLQR